MPKKKKIKILCNNNNNVINGKSNISCRNVFFGQVKIIRFFFYRVLKDVYYVQMALYLKNISEILTVFIHN